MSKYEDYNSTSRNYDNQRFAMGSDVMAAMIQFHCGKPLKDLHVLDAGCGTGNYAKALIEYGVGHVTLLDASSGMLEKAKVKLADEIKTGKIKDVVECTMPPIPFPDASFDAVMFNLVLHHFDTGSDDRSFPTATQAIQEAKRVTVPGGVIVITTCLPSAISDGTWMTQLNRDISARFNKHNPSMEDLEKMFMSSGISCVQKLNIIGSAITKEYYNFEGPLDEAWRKTSSYWQFATEQELEDIKRKITDLKSRGELEKWARDHDRSDTSGVITMFTCKCKQ